MRVQIWKFYILLLLSTEALAFGTQKHVIHPSKHEHHGSSNPIYKIQISSKARPSIRRLPRNRMCSGLLVAASMDEEESESTTMSMPYEGITTDRLADDMPWSDIHAYALADNLPRYIRVLPGKTLKAFALWRTMLQDVPELSGYPIDFLRSKCTRKEENAKGKITIAPEVLPFLDEFCFDASGGLSGLVYGAPGLKDGAKIETSPVVQVELTVPLGYVLTEVDGVAYELGRPLVSDEVYSLDGVTRTISTAGGALRKQALIQRGVAIVDTDSDPSTMLLNLGASTGLVLASAAVMNMLSHHLTVNIFWV